MGLRPRHQLPGAEIAGRARKCANAFRGQQARLDRADDAAGDLILYGKDVAKFAVVLLGPVMSAGYGVDQLLYRVFSFRCISLPGVSSGIYARTNS